MQFSINRKNVLVYVICLLVHFLVILIYLINFRLNSLFSSFCRLVVIIDLEFDDFSFDAVVTVAVATINEMNKFFKSLVCFYCLHRIQLINYSSALCLLVYCTSTFTILEYCCISLDVLRLVDWLVALESVNQFTHKIQQMDVLPSLFFNPES